MWKLTLMESTFPLESGGRAASMETNPNKDARTLLEHQLWPIIMVDQGIYPLNEAV